MSNRPPVDQLDEAVTGILANAGTASSVDASIADLLELARELRDLPRPDFKVRLGAQLAKDASMTTTTVQSRPGLRTVTPYIVVPAAQEMIEFVKHAFGAEETFRGSSGPGAIHAEVRIGDSMMMIGGGPGYAGPAKPAAIHLYVENADEVYRRALDAGAVSTLEMTESHGERFGCVQDLFGNPWIIATYLAGPSMPEHHHTVTPFVYAHGAAEFIAFLKEAFGAEELLRVDSSGGEVKHAKLKIGDSVIATGEARELPSLATMLYLYVPDADAAYAQAIRAGAQSIQPPADQRYGVRSGGVADRWGHHWFMATPL
jgi:PhnB protein